MIDCTFYFKDNQFGQEDRAWECHMPVVPRVGDDVFIPEEPSRFGDHEAMHATVESVTWFLRDGATGDHHVAIYCDVEWEPIAEFRSKR